LTPPTFPRSFPGPQVSTNTQTRFFPIMATQAADLLSTYGDISNAPGRRQQARTIETLAGETSSGITGATTVEDAYDAIFDIVLADRAVTTNSIGRASSVSAVQGRILSLSTLVGGSNYVTGTYSAVALTGGTGTGATANITVNNAGGIIALDTLVGGTLYDDGTYTAVPLTGGTGTGAQATIVVASGAVTTVTLTASGTGYTDNDVLSASDANLGNLGTGSGFSISVNGTKGAVSAVSLVAGGSAYDVGEVLSASNTNLGGAGSGFSITVASTTGPINA
jgi:hypothetical protein